MESFFLELKNLCKSYKVLVLILILFLFQLVFIQQALEEGKKADSAALAQVKGNIAGQKATLDLYDLYREKDVLHVAPEHYESAREYYQYLVELRETAVEAFTVKDWSLYHRLDAEWRFLYWDHLHNISPTPQEYFGGDWTRVKEILEYREFDLNPGALLGRAFIANEIAPILFNATLYLDLAKTGLPPTGPHDTSPWAFLFNFLRSGLPSILGAIVLLMTVNILHRDMNSGAIKTTLSAPKSRTRYLLRKLSLGFSASLGVTLLPQLLTFLILGLKHGFRGLSYPVLLDKYILSHLTPFPDRTISIGFYDVELSKIPRMFDIARLEFFDTVPLWQFLGLAAVQVLLFIFFCTVLGLLISIVIKNEVIAHLAAAVIFVAGGAFGSIFSKLSNTPLDLFAKADVVPLLEGSLASTYLSSLLALAIASILLFHAGASIFGKQDVVSKQKEA